MSETAPAPVDELRSFYSTLEFKYVLNAINREEQRFPMEEGLIRGRAWDHMKKRTAASRRQLDESIAIGSLDETQLKTLLAALTQ